MERKIVSILFADLVGFTSLSEQLDAEDVATIQAAYFETVRDTVGRYGGRLEKFIGDAAMAVFGVPVTGDDDAERAVRAGLALTSAVDQLDARLGLETGALRVRVGVNTGEVVHSTDARPDEAVVTGDTVNAAARLQTAAPVGGVLLGETTALAVAAAIELEPREPLSVKGKSEQLRTSVAAGVRDDPSRAHAVGALKAPVIGRAAELETLADALHRARAGSSERVAVIAPPGIGKTRLVEEFAAAAPVVWRARLRPDLLSPYASIAQLVRAALESARRSPETLEADLTGTGLTPARATVVAQALGAVTERGRDAAAPADRESLFAAWLEGLDALAGDVTPVLLVEDVHWAGPDLLAFLAHAGEAPSPHGRLVVATARPSLLEDAPAWSDDSDPRVTVIDLLPLDQRDAATLVRELVGDALPPELIDRIAAQSDGNALFVEELLRVWASTGVLSREGARWRLLADPGDAHLPITVQAIYGAQLDDLPAAARHLARRASVAGRRFDLGALDALGVPDPDAAIAALLARGFLLGRAGDDTRSESYRFRHALLRDAAYASLARVERARLHARLAAWLAETAHDGWGERAEVIGRHYAAALESVPALAREVDDGLDREEAATRAALWTERGARAALDAAAHETARSLVRRALELTPDDAVPDRARRTALLGAATAFAADMDEGARAYQAAAALYREILGEVECPADRREAARSGLADALAALGRIAFQQLRFAEGGELGELGLREIGEREDSESARLLLLRAGARFLVQDAGPEAPADARRALAIARSAADGALELEAVEWLARGQAELGELDPASWREVERLASRERRWESVVSALRMQVSERLDDRAAAAEPIADHAAEIASAHGLTESLAWVDYARTEIGFVAGDWDAALARGAAALDLGVRNSYHRVVVRTWYVVLPIAVARGTDALVDSARTWHDARLGLFPDSPYARVMHSAIRAYLAEAGFEDPPVPDPERLLPSFHLDHATPSWLAAIEAIVGRWLAAGDLATARRAVEAIAGSNERRAGASSLARGLEALLRARLFAAEGNRGAAGENARTALGHFRTSSAPWWTAKSIRLLEAGGEASRELVEEAGQIDSALGSAAPTPERSARRCRERRDLQ